MFDGENISFDASLVMYINSTNIPPIVIINRIYETQNLLYKQKNLHCYYSDGPGIDSRCGHWIFSVTYSFRPYHGPGVDSAPSENEYQEHFLGVKAACA